MSELIRFKVRPDGLVMPDRKIDPVTLEDDTKVVDLKDVAKMIDRKGRANA